jgi:hypothetical protein
VTTVPKRNRQREQGAPTVAPAERLRQELRYLQSRETLRTRIDVEEMIFIQSLTGRAHEGHGGFRGRRYVDTAEDDVAAALRLDPWAVRQDRQELLDSIGAYARRAMAGEAPEYLLDEDGEPLLGMGFFRFMPVIPHDVLRGLYLGGLRDTPEARIDAEKRYGVTIGTGKMFFVNTEVMRRMDLHGDRLANEDHEAQIDAYRDAGLIVETPPAPDNPISFMYVRYHRGPGASDDAAIVAGGLKWGGSVSAGIFLADAIDTLEKYVPLDRYGDQDADLGRVIEREYPKLDVGWDDVCALAFLGRGGEGPEDLPDSSLRHMLRVDRNLDQCAIESHLLAAAGREVAPMPLGHERCPSDRFYREVERRVNAL